MLRNPFYWRTRENRFQQLFDSGSNWIEVQNRKDFFDRLGNGLDFKSLEDFYKIRIEDLKKCGGNVLFERLYDNLLLRAFEDVYPHHIWHEWRFLNNNRMECWNHDENQKDFLDELGKQLGFKTFRDWYNISTVEIIKNGGNGLLSKYGKSSAKLVMSVYSKHKWKHINFNGYWNNNERRRDFLDSLGKQLGYKKIEDWNRITKKIIRKNGGKNLLTKYGESPIKLIGSTYSWDMKELVVK